MPRRRTRSQLPSCSGVIASLSASSNSSCESGRERAGRCDCFSACCQACVSLVVRGVGRRNSERHRRAADKRLLLPVIWLVAERQQARTADSEREWHTQHVSAFHRGSAGADAPDAHKKGRARRSTTRCHSASCRTLGTLANFSYTHCCTMYVPCCSSVSLPSRTIEDTSRKVKFETFCDHAAHGRLADVQRMLECGKLRGYGNLNDALWRAAQNGHVDVVDCLLRHAMFDPSAYISLAIRRAAANGHLVVVERLLQDERVDPSAKSNEAIGAAAECGHHLVVDRLLQDKRVNPSANYNDAVRSAAACGHLAVVERLLQDARVDPSAMDSIALPWAAQNGHLAVVQRLLQDARVDPSTYDNAAVGGASQRGHFAIVERLLEDDRVDVATALQHSRPEHRKRFECRERLTEICFALQDLELPAWITVQIETRNCETGQAMCARRVVVRGC